MKTLYNSVITQPLVMIKQYQIYILIVAVGVCIGFATKAFIHTSLTRIFTSPHVGVFPYILDHIAKITPNKTVRSLLDLMAGLFTDFSIWFITVLLTLIFTLVILRRYLDFAQNTILTYAEEIEEQ